MEFATDEILRLRDCLNGLVSIMALPALWTGAEPAQIVSTLLDALIAMLGLQFAFVRLNNPAGGPGVERMRAGTIAESAGEQRLELATARLGLQGELGLIVAGSDRPGFPQETERLLLDVAVNQAVIGLQQARLLSEQRRVSLDLDRRVAERTAEVAAAYDELARRDRESRLADEALNAARAELAHVAHVTSLSTLTASIAHEINQPLSAIVTNASTCVRMLDGDSPNAEGARETARRTIRDANRAADVITRLRALFAKKDFAFEPLDLNDAVREVIAMSLGDLRRNRVILESHLADGLPSVIGDRVQLQQVILNLLRNASDAMVDVEERQRDLLIRTERDGGDLVRVTVRDAGVGITPESLRHMFDAFYTTKNGGMGIGLSVSRSIVERHRGRLWAEANSGPGATFSLSLPCDLSATVEAGTDRPLA
jgi:C4-dicarboxylate-specific signal transduction histidine kinase